MPRRMLTIARWTAVEILRERVFYVVLIFAVVLVASSIVLTPLAPGAQKKVVVDLGLAAIDTLGILVILFSGASLVRRDLERRSLDILLTKPVTRFQYLAGKWLGLVLTLTVLTLGMTAILAASLELCGFGWRARYLEAILGSGLQMLVVASVAVLFSSFTSPMLASLFTLAIFVGGNLSEGMLRTIHANGGNPTLEWLSLGLPALSLFNVRSEAVHGLAIGWDHALVAITYACLYSTTALYVAALVFRRRDFR